jgi:hypothetical protein
MTLVGTIDYHLRLKLEEILPNRWAKVRVNVFISLMLITRRFSDVLTDFIFYYQDS